MVNADSDLFRAHPQWAVRIPGRRHTMGRNQFVLDLANPQVQDYIIEAVGRVLDSAPISYVKWDMNRTMSDAYSPTLDEQGRFFHAYILGLYRVLGAIFGPRPHILLESCASGGNRFDLGMLCYSPQVWTSDDTDPVERLAIQGGMSYLYPPHCMGAHVSQAPHQQTLRNTPLSTRFNVAAFGVLGYELDLKYLTRLEKKEIREQIAWYKAHRATFQFGRFSRLDSRKSTKVEWQVVAHDGTEAICGIFQTLATANEGYDALRAAGLEPGRRYTVSTRPQYLYLGRFGGLVKHILPVDLNPGGIILRTAGKVYKLTDCVESYAATGALLAAGIMLNNQFAGSTYNEHTRLLGDFGSTLYVIKADGDG
jgi:alpha-galactosidase